MTRKTEPQKTQFFPRKYILFHETAFSIKAIKNTDLGTHFGVIFARLLYIYFSIFPVSLFAQIFWTILKPKWSQKDSKMEPQSLQKHTLTPKRTLACILLPFCSHLVAIWLHFGSLLAPFQAFSLPFVILSALFGPL